MHTRSAVTGLTLFLMVYFLSACSLLETFSQAGETVTATPPSEQEPTVVPAGVEAIAPDSEADATATPGPPQDLIVWAVTDINGLDMLADQIERFTTTQGLTDTTVIFDRKASSGPGGIQRYLEAAPEVAPTILPDLILIPFSLLPQLVDAELVFPLLPLVDTADFNDLFPAGRTISRVGEQFYGYPYSFTNFNHLVYNRITLTETLTSEWDSFATLPNQFVFAGGGSDGADLLLMLYLAEGGTLRDETGRIRLEEEQLRNALNRVATAAESGLIYPSTDQILSQSGSWDIYRNGSADIVLTDSQLYRNQIGQIVSADFAPLPGPQEAVPARTKGFVWAISTADPQRQQLAAELLNYLIAPENMGALSYQSLGLPTRRSAFDSWPTDDYTIFLQDQLDRASVYPTAALGPVSDALSVAMRTLLASSSPTAAVPDIARTTVSAIP